MNPVPVAEARSAGAIQSFVSGNLMEARGK
jgi:hypothetical protein